jgi:hypothetical protein
VFCCEARPRGKRGRKGEVVKYVRDGDEHSVEKRRREKNERDIFGKFWLSVWCRCNGW